MVGCVVPVEADGVVAELVQGSCCVVEWVA